MSMQISCLESRFNQHSDWKIGEIRKIGEIGKKVLRELELDRYVLIRRRCAIPCPIPMLLLDSLMHINFSVTGKKTILLAKKSRKNRSERAGLVFPVTRLRRYMKVINADKRLTSSAPGTHPYTSY